MENIVNHKKRALLLGNAETSVSSSMMKMFNATSKIVSKRQDMRAAADGEIHASGIFLNFPVLREVDGRKTNVPMSSPPDKQFGDTKEGKKYPKPLKINLSIHSLTIVDGDVEALPEGNGWRVRTAVNFSNEAQAFLRSNYKAYYAEQLNSRVPLSEFISEDGELCTERWMVVHKNQTCKARVSDNENCVFRTKMDNGGFLVTPRTAITLAKCNFEQWVALSKTPDENGDEQESVVGYVTLVSKGGVRLSDQHDPDMPLSERVRRQEDPDVHCMIPVVDLAQGKAPPVWRTFMNFSPGYQSPEGSSQGVTFLPFKDHDIHDYVSRYNDQLTVKVIFRGIFCQWKDSSENESSMEIYSLKVGGYRDVWKSYGIPDHDCYGHIMMASPIWTLAQVSLWKSDMLKQEENQRKIAGIKEEDPLLDRFLGYYTYGIDSLTPNYLEMLPQVGIAVSADWVKEKFSDFVGTKGKGNKARTTMDFTPLDPTWPNPLHTRGLDSPVISLGNNKLDDPDSDTPKPVCHGFHGDFWPRIDSVDFYVLSSHRFNPENEEEHADIALLGARKDGDFSGSEALINRFIQEEGVFWWLFAVNRDALKYTQREVAPPAKKQAIKKKEDVKDVKDEPEPMEVDDEKAENEEEDEEEEVKPSKKASVSKSTPSKKAGRKKKLQKE